MISKNEKIRSVVFAWLLSCGLLFPVSVVPGKIMPGDLTGINSFYNDDDGDSCDDQILTLATDDSAWTDVPQWGIATLTVIPAAKDPIPADGAEGVSTTPVISTFISSDVPKDIPDWQWTTEKNIIGEVTSTLNVPDSINIKDLNVELDITMPGKNADLNVHLTSPDGKEVKLFDDVGVLFSHFTNTILDDEAGTSVEDGRGTFTGIFKPEGQLSDFDDRNTMGTWELKITDDWPGGPGKLNSWRIVVENPIIISWTPGYGDSQDVYFSDAFDDVNGVGDAGLMANLPIDATSYEIGALALDTTYYWRVDEVDANGIVTNMGDVWSFSTQAGNVMIHKRIAAGTDDAEEDLNPDKLGEVDVTSKRLEMPYEDTGMGDPQIIGLRFTDMDLPVDTAIIESWILFEVDEIKDGTLPVNLIIEGELNPDPGEFVGGGPETFDISGRPKTDANVPWSVPIWATVDDQGPDQTTSDITEVLQEIISQPDWAPGNALVLIISDDPCNPSKGHRGAESYDGEASAAPLLYISGITEIAGNPVPADGAIDVAQETILSWSPGFTGVSRDVYFGTVDPPVKLEATTGTSYDVGTLEMSTTYYWKIDEIDADGTKHPGPVWSFKTVEPPNLLDLAVQLNSEGDFAGTFDTLIAAVLAADPAVADALAGDDQLTVFAPTDEAFAALELTPENIGGLDQVFLTDVLLYHVTAGRLLAADVLAATQIEMLKGGFLLQDGGILTDNLGGKATIIVTDVEASNGVIHVIDAVVLPKAPTGE